MVHPALWNELAAHAPVIAMMVLPVLWLPGVLVLMSSKVRGRAKIGWALAMLLLSWPGYVLFWLLYRQRPVAYGEG